MSILPFTTVPAWLILKQPGSPLVGMDMEGLKLVISILCLPWRLVLWSGVPGRTLASPQVAIENINAKFVDDPNSFIGGTVCRLRH